MPRTDTAARAGEFRRVYGPWAVVTGASSGIGRALAEALARRGLDLRRTSPPVHEVVDELVVQFPQRKMVIAVQIHETTLPDSIEELSARWDCARHSTYDIDPPRRNHGLLLGTIGWLP